MTILFFFLCEFYPCIKTKHTRKKPKKTKTKKPPKNKQINKKIVVQIITKTYLYNFDPLKPHFYIVKLGFKGVYIIFLISTQKHRLWVLVRTASSRRF